MRSGRRSSLLLASLTASAVAAALAAPGANAAVQTVSIDGPSAALVGSDDIRVDVAPDGTAAVAWRKVVAAQDHVFVSVRQGDGTWSAPEQVDDGLPGAAKPSSRPSIAVADGGRVVVMFANGDAGFEKLYTAIKPSTAAAFSPVQTVQGDTAGWKDPQLDLAPNGNGYVAVQEAKHVRAFRIQGTTFEPVGAGFPNPNDLSVGGGVLNVDEPEPGDMRGAKLAVDATGATATVIWTESPTGGEYHFFARRLGGILATQAGPRVESTVGTFQGHAGTTSFSDMGTVATSGATTWVGYRAAFTYNSPPQQIPRAIARTFDGTTFGPPQAIDGIPAVTTQGAEYPRIALNAAGQGIAASYRQLAPFGTESSILTGGTWGPSTFASPGPSEAAGRAAVAIDGGGAGLVAFHLTPTPTTSQVLGRIRGGAQDGQLQPLSDPAFGAASSPFTAGAGGGRGVTAFLQGEAATTRVVVAAVDLPPVPAPTPTPTTAPIPTPTATPISTPGHGSPDRTVLTAVKFRNGKTTATVRRGTSAIKLVTAKSSTRTFSFSLTKPASVSVSATRLRVGHTSKGRCVAGAAKSKASRCTVRQAVKGLVRLQGKAGVNQVQFDGRLPGTKALSLGRYELSLIATAPGLAASQVAKLTAELLGPSRRR